MLLSFSKLQETLTIREEMFREMKESKENEIFSVKQIKRELEQRIASLLNEENSELRMYIAASSILVVATYWP